MILVQNPHRLKEHRQGILAKLVFNPNEDVAPRRRTIKQKKCPCIVESRPTNAPRLESEFKQDFSGCLHLKHCRLVDSRYRYVGVLRHSWHASHAA
jgi:hypothetical protein